MAVPPGSPRPAEGGGDGNADGDVYGRAEGGAVGAQGAQGGAQGGDDVQEQSLEQGKAGGLPQAAAVTTVIVDESAEDDVNAAT